MRIFFDECVSSKLVKAIREIEDRPTRQLIPRFEKFKDGECAKDEEWLVALASEGDWVVVSADARIPKGGITRSAWKQAQLTSYFFVGDFARHPRWTQALELVRWFPIIIDHARTAPKGSGWRLPFKGSEPQEIDF